MVGSRDYFDKEIDGNYNVATAERQPGSSFKPIVYAKAFEMGYRPETVLFDVPTQFGTECSPDSTSDDAPCYFPGNYDGKFRGPMSLRNALAQSINIPAVKLLYLVGVNNAIDLAEKMGLTTLTDRSRFGLSLVLGGGEVTLLQMTSAYSVFSDNGIKHPYTGILKVEDDKGKTLEQYEDNPDQIIDPDVAHLVSDVLSDNTARTPVFGASSSLYFPGRDVAAKTGTTNNYRDTWVIGYTPQITVGAWAGNNDNTPIAKQVAGYIVAPMWHEFMNEVLANLPDEKFQKPEVKDISNLKPVLRGVWQGPQGIHSILYYVDKSNPLGDAPSNPANDPQFSRWEYAINRWLGEQGIPNISTGVTNTDTTSINILFPTANTTLHIGDRLDVSVNVTTNEKVQKVSYFLEGNYLGYSEIPPYNYALMLDDKNSSGGANKLEAVLTTASGLQKSSSVTFNRE